MWEVKDPLLAGGTSSHLDYSEEDSASNYNGGAPASLVGGVSGQQLYQKGGMGRGAYPPSSERYWRVPDCRLGTKDCCCSWRLWLHATDILESVVRIWGGGDRTLTISDMIFFLLSLRCSYPRRFTSAPCSMLIEFTYNQMNSIPSSFFVTAVDNVFFDVFVLENWLLSILQKSRLNVYGSGLTSLPCSPRHVPTA